jgi:hypothetical protein
MTRDFKKRKEGSLNSKSSAKLKDNIENYYLGNF